MLLNVCRYIYRIDYALQKEFEIFASELVTVEATGTIFPLCSLASKIGTKEKK